MKHIKLYRTKEQAIGQVIETPAIIMTDRQTAFAPQSLGEKIELSQDENGELIVSIYEEELPEGVVDLGLPSGLKWASCNIGANSPCESGLLFQFGRVDGYAYGSPLGTSFEAKDGLIKTTSIPPTQSGTVYKVGEVLKPADDAASVATNGKMRMPTAAEIDELLANTTNQWCQCTVLGADHTSHNVYGRLFISKADESKKIFIPAAGYFNGRDDSFYYAGSSCYVWSSSVRSDNVNDAYFLGFDSGNYHGSYSSRRCSFSVRGVCK